MKIISLDRVFDIDQRSIFFSSFLMILTKKKNEKIIIYNFFFFFFLKLRMENNSSTFACGNLELTEQFQLMNVMYFISDFIIIRLK